MDLNLNRQSQLPIHVQLKAQLAHLIQAGQLAPGGQLPTVRQLAGFLRINRNTVSKVFAELQREGYLSCEPGRGTFVSKVQGEAEAISSRMGALLAVVDASIRKAQHLGFSPGEFATALYARTQTTAQPGPIHKVPVLLIECNRPQLRLFGAQLAEALPLRVTPLLIAELAGQMQRTSGFLERYDLAITTFFHVREVQALLADLPIEVVALLAEASLETLRCLTALPEGTKVGVACQEWTGTENVKLSIQNAGLTHIQLIPGCGKEPESVRQMLNEVSVVVCSSLVAAQIRTMAPRRTEILVDDRRLDQAGIELLRQRLETLPAGAGSRKTPKVNR
jgi:DNA-binding transcriptional regulator YhcF (GntR family)